MKPVIAEWKDWTFEVYSRLMKMKIYRQVMRAKDDTANLSAHR